MGITFLEKNSVVFDKLSPQIDKVVSSANKQECILTENTISLIKMRNSSWPKTELGEISIFKSMEVGNQVPIFVIF